MKISTEWSQILKKDIEEWMLFVNLERKKMQEKKPKRKKKIKILLKEWKKRKLKKKVTNRIS